MIIKNYTIFTLSDRPNKNGFTYPEHSAIRIGKELPIYENPNATTEIGKALNIKRVENKITCNLKFNKKLHDLEVYAVPGVSAKRNASLEQNIVDDFRIILLFLTCHPAMEGVSKISANLK